jgi:SAM-dependent methyltransferase
MDELLQSLPQRAVVLDVGSGPGSFDWSASLFTVVRVDLECRPAPGSNFVQADVARLPFGDSSFEAVISSHSLEHFNNLAASLEEIGRVVKPSGALFVTVPDATTISDRLYRWLARGGGHVNPFSSAEELARRIERATGLRHVATRTLCSSLSFLNRRNCRTRPPRRLLLLGGGTEASLLLLTYFFRMLDRLLGTRTSVYGWALYFGSVTPALNGGVWTNVCIRCGAGHPSQWLLDQRRVLRHLPLAPPVYRCPRCQAVNVFTDDRDYSRLAEACTEPPQRGAFD